MLPLIIGPGLASFLMLVAYRVGKRDGCWKEVLWGRSKCDSCKKELSWGQLIPVVGWLVNRGQCKYCSNPVSVVYPIGEILLMGNFFLLSWQGFGWEHYLLSLFLFFVGVYDFYYQRVPRWLVHAALFMGAVYFFVGIYAVNISISLLSFLEGIVIFFLITLINIFKRSFGLADGLVLVLISFFVQPTQVLKVLFGAALLGVLLEISFLVSGDKDWRKKRIPFLPLIYVGFVIVVGLGL